MNDLFLDTGYVVALISKRDQHHKTAHQLAEKIKQSRPRIVTTQAVLVEVGNALASLRHRATTAEYIDMLRREPVVEIVQTSKDLLERGFALYKERQDKEWGWTDCMSFVVMRDRGIRDALSADKDFEQAGFNALLRES